MVCVCVCVCVCVYVCVCVRVCVCVDNRKAAECVPPPKYATHATLVGYKIYPLWLPTYSRYSSYSRCPPCSSCSHPTCSTYHPTST